MIRRSIFRYLASLALIPFVGVERAKAIRNASAEGEPRPDHIAMFNSGVSWDMVGEGKFGPNPDWCNAMIDSETNVIWGVRRDGGIGVADGVELRVIASGQTLGWYDADGWHYEVSK